MIWLGLISGVIVTMRNVTKRRYKSYENMIEDLGVVDPNQLT